MRPQPVLAWTEHDLNMALLPGFSLNAVSSLLLYGLGFFNQALLARVLPPAEYGHLAIMATTVMFGGLLLGEWLQRGATYVVGRDRAEAEVTGSALVYCAVIALVVMGMAIAGRNLTGNGFRAEWILVAGITVLHATQKSGQGINLGSERLSIVAVTPLVMICAYLGGNALAVFAGVGLQLHTTLWIWLGAMGLSAAVAYVPALRTGYGNLVFRRAIMAQTLCVGARGAVAAALIFLLFRSSIWLLGYLATPLAAASFRVALTFADLMQRLPNVAGMVLLAHVVRGHDRSGQLSLQVAQATMAFSLLAAAGIGLAGRAALAIAFPRYPEAYIPLMCMLPGLVCTGPASVLNTKLAGTGYPAVMIWAPAVALAVLMGCSLLLVPRWGLAGAGLAVSAAHITWSTLVVRAYMSATGHGWRRFLRWSGFDDNIQ